MSIRQPEPMSRDPLTLLKLNVGIVASCNRRNAQSCRNARLRLYAGSRPVEQSSVVIHTIHESGGGQTLSPENQTGR